MGASNFTTPEDLLADDRFVDWALSDGTAHKSLWENWLLAHPEKATIVEEARFLALQLSRPNKSLPTSSEWEQLQSRLHTVEPKKARYAVNWWRAAAAVLVLFAAAYWLWPQQQAFQTAYGEIQTITLPDRTEVVLQANSRLWWEGEWAEAGIREVHLDGEAYFSVRAAEDVADQAFRVNASPLTVEVLGTEFNLVNRSKRAGIVLVEGQVAVSDVSGGQALLKPNEHYSWNTAEQKAATSLVDPQLFTAWKKRIWRFEATPLSEVAQLVEDNFGKTIVFANPQLAKRTLSGSVPASSLNILVQGLSTTLGIEVQQGDTEIIFAQKAMQEPAD